MRNVWQSEMVKEEETVAEENLLTDETPVEQGSQKAVEEIINNIYDTVEITKIIKPIYNFKSN